jgi:hypothetical protein
MQIELSTEAQSHILFWQQSGNKAILKKIEKLTPVLCAGTPSLHLQIK